MIRLTDKQAKQTQNTVLLAGIGVTMIVWTTLTDPIGLPKMFVLTILAAWIAGTIGVVLFKARARDLLSIQWAVLIFSLAIFLAALLTDVQYTAFYGAAQRNNGAIIYLSFATLMFAATLSFNQSSVSRYRNSLLVVGGIMTAYGLLQIANRDPFHWVLLYAPVVGTLGNPDFMSAFLGTVGIVTVWFILSYHQISYRLSGLVLLLLELFVMKRSGSFQGILAFAIGLVILVLAKLWQIKKQFGLISTVIVAIFSVPVIMGLTNHGPLATYLYRSSMQNRLDYWRAAFGMFKAHPFFGVGLDRFAENYGQYAPTNQVVLGQATDNAHNVFLQLLSTGGLLVILPYLSLVVLILHKAIQGLRKTEGQTQIDLVGIFTIWLVLLLISIISIDNLGLAVWFWISGGVLYAVAHDSIRHEELKNSKVKKEKKGKGDDRIDTENYLAPLVSLALGIVALLIVLPSIRTSSAIFDMQVNRSQLAPAQFLNKIEATAKIWPRNSITLYSLSDIALRIDKIDLALNLASQVIKLDPKSNYGNQLSAIAYERSKKYQKAITFRKRVVELDPWNLPNMVEIVRDYVALKDLPNAKAIAEEINKIQPNGDLAKAAVALIKG
ncbi:MAG: O-antigen ligase family protein [Actinobacteria bacterium]|nr:O-antigen ligase family protein [Actinomycetota bacterium]